MNPLTSKPAPSAPHRIMDARGGMMRRRYQRGSIRDDKDRWQIRWREDVRLSMGTEPRKDDTVLADGTIIRRVYKWDVLSKKRFPTKRLAQRELDCILATVNSQNYQPVRSETFSQFANQWKRDVMIHHDRSTQELDTRYIEKTLKPAFGQCQMREISAEMVQTWVSSLTVGPKTVRNFVGTFKLMWKSAKAWKHVDHDPFDGLKLPKKKKAKAYTFSAEEMMAIINEAKGHTRLIFELFAFGGMRPGEQAGLRPEDLKGRVLHVHQAVYKGKIKESLKSDFSERQCPVPDWLADKIRAYIEEAGPNRHGLIFVNKDGNPLNSNHYNDKSLKPILKKLGIWKKARSQGLRIGCYGFRHGSISLLRNNGIPLSTIQARVGHAPGSNITDIHYVAPDAQKSYAASDLLDALLNPNTGGTVQ